MENKNGHLGDEKPLKRLEYIDFLKAFAIFSVVLGHMCQFYWRNLENSVYHHGIMPWHMPLFAILSGLFFSVKDDVKTFVDKKNRQLFLPFIIWCFIVHFVCVFIIDIYSLYIEGQVLQIESWFISFRDGLMEDFWFLRSLFFSFLLAYTSINIFKRNVTIGVILSVCILYTLTLTGIIPNMKMPCFIYLYPFFCTGIIMREYKNFIFIHANGIIILSLVTFLVCIHFWQGFDDTFYLMNTSMREPEGHAGITGWLILFKTVYRFITGVSASMMVILLARRFEKSLPTYPIVMSIGRNTLGIYILQCIVFNLIPIHPVIMTGFFSLVLAIIMTLALIMICDYCIRLTSHHQLLALLLWGKRQ